MTSLQGKKERKMERSGRERGKEEFEKEVMANRVSSGAGVSCFLSFSLLSFFVPRVFFLSVCLRCTPRDAQTNAENEQIRSGNLFSSLLSFVVFSLVELLLLLVCLPLVCWTARHVCIDSSEALEGEGGRFHFFPRDQALRTEVRCLSFFTKERDREWSFAPSLKCLCNDQSVSLFVYRSLSVVSYSSSFSRASQTDRSRCGGLSEFVCTCTERSLLI